MGFVSHQQMHENSRGARPPVSVSYSSFVTRAPCRAPLLRLLFSEQAGYGILKTLDRVFIEDDIKLFEEVSWLKKQDRIERKNY
jgi:hypothetical protein